MTEHSAPNELEAPIVAAVDGSAVAYHAAAWAAAEAAWHGWPLRLVVSAALPAGWGPGAMMVTTDIEAYRKDFEPVVVEARRIARTVGGESLTMGTEVTSEPVIPYLIAWSRRARMVVVGSRGLGALRRGLLGSVSDAVVHHAQCPVAVVHWSATDAVSAASPVLVGVDGTENSAPAVELAFEEASLRKTGLTALHCWSDTSALTLSVTDWDTLRDKENALLAESLAGYCERYPDVAVERKLVRDHPVRALLDESDKAQLVVVGSHGRGGFAGMLLGSTSNALVRAVECPIIVVRERPRVESGGEPIGEPEDVTV
jgi:nucleotide-binding universal stress UspA family protein